jgi:hypothetical protein
MRGLSPIKIFPRIANNYTPWVELTAMNQTRRRTTAVLLTLTLLLSGCLGPGDDSTEGRDDGSVVPTAQASSTTTVVNGNYLPMVQASQMGTTEANLTWAWENETVTTTTSSANGTTTNTTETTSSYYNGTLVGINVTVYHSAIDPEGGAMAMGWDLNLDGTVDLPVSSNSGFTTISLPVNQWHDIPTTEMKIKTVAFVAMDTPGDRAIVFLDIYSATPEGPWSTPHPVYGHSLFAFSGEDAQGNPTDGTEDNLIMLTMDQGGDINWASVSVKLSIDGGAPVFCDNPGNTGGQCVLIDNGRDTSDQFWSVGDTVTIQETGQDLCSDTCSIDVTITDTRIERVIDTTNNVAAE